MKLKLSLFTAEMIQDAGRLLALRHQCDRKRFQLLPARFEDPQAATKAVQALWQEKHRNGYAAFRGEQMVAYLIGQTSSDPWGRSGYVYLPGYGLVEGEDPAVMQNLYVLLGDDWVRKGNFNHYLYVSAADEHFIQAWFDLGFGKERIDALLDLRTLTFPDVENPPGVTIRKADTGDHAYLGDLSDVIFRALAEAPHWHPTMPEAWEELREGWSELADDQEWTVWLALEQDEALGTIGFCPAKEADTQLLTGQRTIYLSVAATQPQARGRGINTALTWHGLRQARSEGYEICHTNWISPNLLAARFWPRFGFQDVAYRLAKKVNPMIAWAKQE